MKQLHGFDTETPLGKIGCAATEKEVIDVTSFQQIASWLCNNKNKGDIFFTFNLRFDAQAIIKLLPWEKQKELWKLTMTIYEGYQIKYIPKKLFVISRLSESTNMPMYSVNFYDVAQYFIGYTLNSAAKQFLGKEKLDTIDSARIGKDMQYYLRNLVEIKKYCIQDASLALDLAMVTKKDFKHLDISFNKPISCASIVGKWVKKNKQYPIIPQYIESHHGLAQACYRGGMFQTLQRGYFDEPLYDYDINSAYPTTMSTLPHWGNGRFEVVNSKDPKAEYGWYLCEFDSEYVPYDTKIPWSFSEWKDGVEIKIQTQNHKIIYPSGHRRQALTKIEIDWLRSIGEKVDVLFGVEWNQTEDKFQSPFNWMEKFYNKRSLIKHDKTQYSLQWNMKIIMNSLYGKTAQSKHGKGPMGIGTMANFFYASTITGDTRLKVADVLHHNKNAIINIATDGLLSRKPIEGLKIGSKLGEWEKTCYTKGLVVGSGMLQLWKREEDIKTYNGIRECEYTTKARGITDKKDWNMYEAIKDNQRKDTILFERERPLSLGFIVNSYKKYKPEELNVFTTMGKKLNCNTDKNHNWSKEYKNFGDLLNNKTTSIPLDIKNL